VSALVNQTIKNIAEDIKALPCFVNSDCKIEPITGGESHECFKVTATVNFVENFYFVKSFAGHQKTAKAEISVNILAAKARLAPAIIYHSPLWLVCEFIHGTSLTKFTAEKKSAAAKDKVIIAMNLMVKMHELKPGHNHPVLNIERLLFTLVKDIETTPLLQVFLNKTIEEILPHKVPNNNLVLCHGDVNYENIRLSDSYNKDHLLEKSWLVDYECNCLAESEYDIAMFIAVNALSMEEVHSVIEYYSRFSSRHVDNEKVRAYLACCYLVNGLWYFEAASERNKPQKLINMAREQLVLFDQLALIKQKIASLF
jgi:thiamine kinase-like enzyme